MKRMLMGIFVAGIVGWAGTAAAQTPTVRYSWDNCDPVVVNKQFGAPADVYKQVISGTGFDGLYRGQQMEIVMGPGAAVPFPDAWRFDGAGCQNGQLTTANVSNAALSKACPALAGTNPLVIFQFTFASPTDPPNTAHLTVAGTFDTFDGVGTTQYTLWQITWNHAFSATGPQDPLVACGHAETPMCFFIQKAYYLDETDLRFEVQNFDQRFVTWQDPSNTMNCPSVPTKPVTWGHIKAQYH